MKMGKSVQRAVPVYVCWLFEVPDWLLSLLSIVILFLADDNCTYEYHSTKSPPSRSSVDPKVDFFGQSELLKTPPPWYGASERP